MNDEGEEEVYPVWFFTRLQIFSRGHRRTVFSKVKVSISRTTLFLKEGRCSRKIFSENLVVSLAKVLLISQ